LNKTLSTVLRILLFLAIGLSILWLLYSKLNKDYQAECALKGIPAGECSLIKKVFDDIGTANYFWLAVIVLCFLISNLSRTIRWRYLIDSMGYTTRLINGFHCIMLGYFANLGFPRIGEIVRAGTFAKYEKVPVEKVMGTVTADRIIDLFSFFLVFLLALALEFDTLWAYLNQNMVQIDASEIASSGWTWGVLVMVLLVAVVLYRFRHKLMAHSFFVKLVGLARGFLEGIQSVRYVSKPFSFVFHSVMIWSMYYLMTYLCFDAFEPTSSLGPRAGLLVFVFGSLGMVIPTPGGMGSYHALAVAALVLYGIHADDAFSFAMIIFFTVNIFGNILFGLIALLLLPGLNANYQPVRE
jgi:uncharacterized protein (TIRG00374 family)